jgi:hypothetical protein
MPVQSFPEADELSKSDVPAKAADAILSASKSYRLWNAIPADAGRRPS